MSKGSRLLIPRAMTSITSMFLYMGVLAIGAGFATFIENDYGTAVAREWVYDALWYESFLVLTTLNMMVVILRAKLTRRPLVFLFHLSFVVILIGAGLTRYFGFEGHLEVREGEATDMVKVEGSEVLLPFSIHLVDFELTRYPGSLSPSAYVSRLILNKGRENQRETQVQVNEPVDYHGHRIFQASYSTDEKGSILSINRDPGKHVTYLGYGMLFFGLFFNLFHPKSRLRYLIRRIDKATSVVLVALIFCSNSGSLQAEMSSFTKTYLEEHSKNSLSLSDSFGRLMVQSRMGRIKTLDTLNREVLRKLSRKTSLHGMNANQVVLGIYTRPRLWEKIPLILIKNEDVRVKLGMNDEERLASFTNFFDGKGNYRIDQEVNQASALPPFERNEVQKEILRLDERLAIFLMVQKGTLLKIFPVSEDPMQKWYDSRAIWEHLETPDAQELQNTTREFFDKVFSRDYGGAEQNLEALRQHQGIHGKEVLPTPDKIEAEIFYNQLGCFPRLMVFYLVLGMLSMFLAFRESIFEWRVKAWIKTSINVLGCMGVVLHFLTLGLRSYVSGHMPLSDTYESLLAISFFTVGAGLIFSWRSLFVTSSSLLMGGTFLFVSHLNSIDPEITNLVPVLKSFWLSVHVSVITSSYGFFGVACLLGTGSLILMAIPLRTKRSESSFKMLTDLSEAYIIIGLTLLVIGNFLGAIWANESWGRYWGWDPKETWAYISIITYVLVLHLRLLKGVYSEFLQATCSVIAFSTILMTYFGVNFYLSGKHSYASGDPILVPSWAWIMVTLVSALVFLAWIQHRKQLKV